ncbi:MAG: M56 family metallopeptidase, partial [Ruminiclostridium sp.]|nr:M56 family metallopeptidase [Ruminiclostridium sp.]
MTEFCQTLCTMTAAATVAALIVMILRLPLKKAPRWITCTLWLVVCLRMVCPVTFEAPVSLMPEEITSGHIAQQTMPDPVVAVPVDSPDETPPQQAQEPPVELMAPTTDQYDPFFTLWAVGAGVMALWAVASYARLRRRVADAVLVQDNLYETDRVDTPFVCGFAKPRIYLPVGLEPAHVPHVVRHEQAHIKRLDHLTKPLFWLALCIHWFNPVLWLAYLLFCRDLETACDQKVIRDLDRQDTADYAAALLCLGREKSLPQAVPLAFGEENAKGRVKGVLKYKKPAFWVVLVAVVLCVGAGFLLLADARQGESLEGVPITQASYFHSRTFYPQ